MATEIETLQNALDGLVLNISKMGYVVVSKDTERGTVELVVRKKQ